MGKLTIGTVAIPAGSEEQRQEVKELTVLEEGSSESIFSLIFSQAGTREAEKHEQ
ncbi:MAG: hypothetical protein LBD25_02675 [Coriobacteriales bacterium]|jgi:hypothetical protein|nr:hypothetical protein [Coriobacteriales bacterium]